MDSRIDTIINIDAFNNRETELSNANFHENFYKLVQLRNSMPYAATFLFQSVKLVN